MKMLLRLPLWGRGLMLFMLFLMILSIHINYNISNLKESNNNLQNTVNKQLNEITTIKTKNNQLKTQITDDQIQIAKLDQNIKNVEDEKTKLESQIAEYQKQISELEKQISELKKNKNEINSFEAPISDFGSFKSYTDYRKLKQDSSNPEWKLQIKAYTDTNGLRKIDDYYLCAIGTGWGIKVGEKATVYLSTGTNFNIIMCDTKDDRHTDSQTHTYTKSNHCVVEFYVDKNALGDSIGYGDISKIIPSFAGKVTNIIKIQ